MPLFKEEVKSRSKNPEKRKEKYESNSLFDKKSQLDKTVKDLAKTDHKVGVCFFKDCSHTTLCSSLIRLSR